MAISFIGASSAVGDTVPFPGGIQVGDYIAVIAYRDGSTTAPTTPAGWFNLGSGGANSQSSRILARIATGSEGASLTVTNATGIACAVYRGTGGAGQGTGARLRTSGTDNSIEFGPLTLEQTNGTSWMIFAAGHRTATDVGQTPTGQVRSSLGDVAISDTNGTVTAWAGGAINVNASSGWDSWSWELKAMPVVLPGVGDVVATGFAPTVVISDHKVVAPGTGELIFEGYAPTVVISDNRSRRGRGVRVIYDTAERPKEVLEAVEEPKDPEAPAVEAQYLPEAPRVTVGLHFAPGEVPGLVIPPVPKRKVYKKFRSGLDSEAEEMFLYNWLMENV